MVVQHRLASRLRRRVRRLLVFEGAAVTVPSVPPTYCPLCGDKIINPGAHAERCIGRVARIAPPPEREKLCDCIGAWHERTCEIAYWPPEDAA